MTNFFKQMSFLSKTCSNYIEKRTKVTLLGTSLLNEAFISFFGLMPFILRKDLLASAFQISLFTMVKPAVAVLSFYWSARLVRSRSSLRNNMVIAGVLARVPFLFFVFFDSVWYMIFASAVYMLFSRAAIPSWMEILRLNLEKPVRDRLFSLSSILGYVECIVIAIGLGSLLDSYQSFWKIFFVFSTFLGLIGVFLQLRTPILLDDTETKKPLNFRGLIKPWKEGMALIKQRPDFAKFQLGTNLSGFGIMLAIPASALFYADTLMLSHTEMTIGRYIFMGLGFVLFSPIWVKAMQKFTINFLMGFVCLGFALFPFFISLALLSKFSIYIAFFSYGITQAGSHLLWNLSGPTFAGKEDNSAKYTGVNVLMVGMRGIVAPLLGGLLCEIFSPLAVFYIAIAICLSGCFCMFSKKIFPVEEIPY